MDSYRTTKGQKSHQKLVLRTKFNPDGSVERRKARLVVKGFSQRKDVDYFKTFAPVARLESVRMVMALAVEKKLDVHQLDFVSAYLNGEIKEEISRNSKFIFGNNRRQKKCLNHMKTQFFISTRPYMG